MKINSKIWPAFIYEERTITITIFVPAFWNTERLPRYPHLSPLQHEIEPPLSSFLLYWAFLAKEHLLRIFKGTFFTIKKDTTKSLGLRGIRVLETTSQGEETNANGGTKWRQISKTLKKSFKKITFDRNQIFFSGNVIALCVDLDEKIKKNSLWPL